MNELLQLVARQRLNDLQAVSDMYEPKAMKDPRYFHLWKFFEMTIAEGEALLAQQKYETRRS